MVERDELDNAIRQYKLDDLLRLIGNKSQEMMLKRKSLDKVIWKKSLGGKYLQTFQQWMPIWGLAELSYRAIKNSNDYRSKSPTLEDLYQLNNLLAKVTDENVIKNRKKAVEESRIDVLLGLPQQQLWWQDIVRGGKSTYYNFIRYYLLLKEMPTHFPEIKQKPEDDLLDLTGFGIDDFSKLLFALYAWNSMPSSEINVNAYDKEIAKIEPVITSDNLNKCLNFFTSDYSYYRDEQALNNPLFLKPIVRTSKGNLIISNSFIMARKFYESIYWIIRDKYFSLGLQDFTNAFGHYYEKYVEELLKFYLNLNNFEKIKEEGCADWLIHTNKYVLIVEQKSSLMSLALKKPYPSLEKFKQFLVGFKKAGVQLANTEAKLTTDGKQVIKLILHFESLYFKENYIKPEIKKLLMADGISLNKFFLIDTHEFERLIQVLSRDEDAFNTIINTKIGYEDNPPPPTDGLDFYDVIPKINGWKEIEFLEQYKHVFDALVRELIPKVIKG